MLAAPLYRWEFYASKAAIGLFYMIVLSVASLVLSIVLGRIHYQFGAISDSFGVIYSQGKVLGNFLLAFVAGLLIFLRQDLNTTALLSGEIRVFR